MSKKMLRQNVRNRTRNVLQLLTVLVALFCLPGILFAEKIVVYSAVYPPYQIDDNGKLTGVNTEIVRAIFHNSGIPFEIKYVPWSRAQKIVGDDSLKNSAIYCLGRTKQREQKYRWVGVYFYQKVSFLTLKTSGVRINGLDDVKKYMIGLVRGDMMTEQLTSQGYLKRYEIVRDDILNIRKLFKKRVQAIVTSELAAKYIAREIGLDPNQIEAQYEVSTDGFNLALSRKTPDEVYWKLKASLNKLLNDGTIKKIVDNWR
ncbi:MAG: transporter substrate-binding domain-containing protein [Pseudomonadota bacterium]|jgi:polar amino acid transport system substrate-binding protein